MARAATRAADTTQAGVAQAGAPLGRPTERLPLRQLYQLSVYWLGINAIWGGLKFCCPLEVTRMISSCAHRRPGLWQRPIL